ncbi:MAG: hypothetical protein ACFE9N_16715, partial [Promethearchaeota archaeon]
MKLNKKLFTTLNILLIFSFFFNLSQFSYSNKGESYIDFNSQIKKKLKNVDYWNLTGAPIDIDDNNPSKNWETTVATYNWCRGTGTLQDPYIIENVTIDGQGVGSCIKISNSNEHFIIRNCTLLHSGSAFSVDAGIYLFDVFYGVLIENTCSLNANGILLENSEHNIISNNNTNENN